MKPQKIDESNELELKGFKHAMSRILSGTITLLPIILILVVISILFGFIVSILSPISVVLSGGGAPHWSLHFVSFIVLILLLYSAGSMMNHRLGKKYFSDFEATYLSRIPLYNIFKELIDQFSGNKDMPFKQVVLVDIFGSDVLMTGFVTQVLGNDMYTIYVPTAPNPANGNIYHVPKNRLTFLPNSPESTMRTVISMGVGSTHLFNKKEVDGENLIEKFPQE